MKEQNSDDSGDLDQSKDNENEKILNVPEKNQKGDSINGETEIESNEYNNNNQNSDNFLEINNQKNHNFNKIRYNKRKDLILIDIDSKKTKQKGFTVYQLNLIDGNSNTNDKKELCYRRYKDFEKFYNTLIFRFPHCVFPKLSEKNFMTKIKDDPVFNENRRRELQHFINQLYFHELIRNSEEFKKFISLDFDNLYFDNLPKKYSYPECEKAKKEKNYLRIGVEKLSNYFIGQKDEKSELEKNILNREEEFKTKNKQYKILFEEIKNLYETSIEEIKEYGALSSNLLDLKIIDSDNFNNKNDLNKIKSNNLSNLCKKLSADLSSNSTTYLAEMCDELNCVILDVEGINKAIERYILFNKEYQNIQDIKSNMNEVIMEEKTKIKKDKDEFERNLYDDIVKYDEETKRIYEELIIKLYQYIKTLNENNQETFENNEFEDLKIKI